MKKLYLKQFDALADSCGSVTRLTNASDAIEISIGVLYGKKIDIDSDLDSSWVEAQRAFANYFYKNFVHTVFDWYRVDDRGALGMKGWKLRGQWIEEAYALFYDAMLGSTNNASSKPCKITVSCEYAKVPRPLDIIIHRKRYKGEYVFNVLLSFYGNGCREEYISSFDMIHRVYNER